jgi:hypothetical protein
LPEILDRRHGQIEFTGLRGVDIDVDDASACFGVREVSCHKEQKKKEQFLYRPHLSRPPHFAATLQNISRCFISIGLGLRLASG